MKVALFWWLQSQTFYQVLHKNALELVQIPQNCSVELDWGDMGCGTGLMSRLIHSDFYKVFSYDLDKAMIFCARFLNRKEHRFYAHKNVLDITQTFDAISATSLLSVVDNKEQVLKKLISLLKDENSTLVIIEPTEHLSIKNVWKMINSFQTFMHYKLLLVWAKARQGKAVDSHLFDNITHVSHHYYLNRMIRITLIKK